MLGKIIKPFIKMNIKAFKINLYNKTISDHIWFNVKYREKKWEVLYAGVKQYITYAFNNLTIGKNQNPLKTV